MLNRRRTAAGLVCTASVIAVVAFFAGGTAPEAQGPRPPTTAPVMPRYDEARNLLLPADYREWVLVGSSLGLSYADGTRGQQMFNNTLMEPTAYREFVRTGEFREGTMLALVVQAVGTDAPPARQGQFGSGVQAVEMAVKDRGRTPEGWAYYGFGGPTSGGYRTSAAPQPKERCFDCHEEHAARDKVFMQFYGLLRDVAPAR